MEIQISSSWVHPIKAPVLDVNHMDFTEMPSTLAASSSHASYDKQPQQCTIQTDKYEHISNALTAPFSNSYHIPSNGRHQQSMLIPRMSHLEQPDLDKYTRLRHEAFRELNQFAEAGSARFVAQMRWLDSLTIEERNALHPSNKATFLHGSRRRRHTASESAHLERAPISSFQDDGILEYAVGNSSRIEPDGGHVPMAPHDYSCSDGLVEALSHLSTNEFEFCAEYERNMRLRHRSFEVGQSGIDVVDEDMESHSGSLW
ncbi:hypothetical protein O5D80_004245 [Batrachochytrium dendrobatidis]|nr:hypothetical protein O5D80_004245 [Batrachochytrium dendrobatidis]